MQTLYPEVSDEDMAQEKQDGDNKSVLSSELRENFEAMRALLRSQKREKNQDSEEAERRRKDQAVKTAVSAEAEISRLRNGIAELEALLAMEGDGLDHVPLVAFPSLPPVVPDEPDEPERKGEKLIEGN